MNKNTFKEITGKIEEGIRLTKDERNGFDKFK